MSAAPRFGFTAPVEVATVPPGLKSFEVSQKRLEEVLASPAIRHKSEYRKFNLAGPPAKFAEDKEGASMRQSSGDPEKYKAARLRGLVRFAAAREAGYCWKTAATINVCGLKLERKLGIDGKIPGATQKPFRPLDVDAGTKGRGLQPTGHRSQRPLAVRNPRAVPPIKSPRRPESLDATLTELRSKRDELDGLIRTLESFSW